MWAISITGSLSLLPTFHWPEQVPWQAHHLVGVGKHALFILVGGTAKSSGKYMDHDSNTVEYEEL